MTKIIYRTGQQMREENMKYHPELFKDTPKGSRHPKYFFRGTPVRKLLAYKQYKYFLNLISRGLNCDAAYKKHKNLSLKED